MKSAFVALGFAVACSSPVFAMGEKIPEQKPQKTYSEKEINDATRGNERPKGSSTVDVRRVGQQNGSTLDKPPKK